MSTSLGPSPGHAKDPQHAVHVQPFDGRVQVFLGESLIADSRDALALDEAGYERVFYLPPKAVRREMLIASETRTHCPFKGEARYLATVVDGASADVAWFYPRAYDEVAQIAGYIAFYPDRAMLLTQRH